MNSVTQAIHSFIVCAVVVLLCGGSNPAMPARPKESQSAPVTTADKNKEAVRQITIMAKVIETGLFQSLGRENLVTDGVFEFGGVRGIRIPNVGVIFHTNVKFPLAQGDIPATASLEARQDTLWDRIERGTRPEPISRRFIALDDNDREKIGRLADVVTRSLTEYCDRLAAVGPDENIVVVVGGGDSGRGAASPQDAYFNLGLLLTETQVYQSQRDYAAWRRVHPDFPHSAVSEVVSSAAGRPETWWTLGIKKRNLSGHPQDLAKRGTIRMTEADPAREAKADRQTTIMARILEMSLSSELQGDIVAASMVQRGIQGFYVPGVGALFFAEAKFPVVETAPEAKKEEKKPDLWDVIEDHLEGRPTRASHPLTAGRRRTLLDLNTDRVGHYFAQGVDKAKIERLKSTVLGVLARYGRRLEDLPDNERIVVVVSSQAPLLVAAGTVNPLFQQMANSNYEDVVLETAGSGASAPAVEAAPPRPSRPSSARTMPAAKPAVEATQPAVSAAQEPSDVFNYLMMAQAAPSDLAVRHGSALVITIMKKDLTDDWEDLAKRAAVETYAY